LKTFFFSSNSSNKEEHQKIIQTIHKNRKNQFLVFYEIKL